MGSVEDRGRVDIIGSVGEQAREGSRAEVARERQQQDAKWGQQDHTPAEWVTILGEEFGEACRGAYSMWHDGADSANHREELIHTAAVAIAAIESLDRAIMGEK